MQWGEGCGSWLVVVINGLFINKINLFVQIAAVCGIILGATSIAGGGVVVAAAVAENSKLAGEAFVEQGPQFISHLTSGGVNVGGKLLTAKEVRVLGGCKLNPL